MQLGFHIKYMLPSMLDVEHSQLACPAASASKIRDMGLLAYLVLLKAANAPEQKTIVC